MAKAPAKILGSQIREMQGRLMLVFVGRDGAGRPVEMMLPAEGIDAVFADAHTKLEAKANADTSLKSAEWVRSFHREGTPAKVGRTTDGKIVLIARLGLPDETRLSFAPEHAQELSEALLAESKSLLEPRKERSH